MQSQSRRIAFLIVCCLVVVGGTLVPPAAAGGKRVERVVEAPYDLLSEPAYFIDDIETAPVPRGYEVWCTPQRVGKDCVTVNNRQGELYFRAEATDELGLPVAMTVFMEAPSGLLAGEWLVCGETSTLAIPPRTRVWVKIWTASTTCQGAAKKGTVTMTLSNRP